MEMSLDFKTIEGEIKEKGFAVLHCPDYKQRQEIKTKLTSHNEKWIVKSFIHYQLSGTLVWKCPDCRKCFPNHMCHPAHYLYESGPDEGSQECPECKETFWHSGDDDDKGFYQTKNAIIVTLHWKGKRYYGKQLAKKETNVLLVQKTIVHEKSYLE